MRSLICGPPPWTTTGRIPTERISTTSCANNSSASASVPPARALPPYLTTTTRSQNRRMYGNASTSTAAFSAGPASVRALMAAARRS